MQTAAGDVVWPENGHRYLLTPEIGSWHEARDYATSVGGYLVSVTSQVEQNFIVSTFYQGQGTGSLWIGLTDEVQEGTFVWESGEAFNFYAWFGGEPKNASASPAGEDYVVIYDAIVLETGGLWNDYPSPFFNGNPIEFRGIVEIVPSPSAAALLMVGLAPVVLKRRRA